MWHSNNAVLCGIQLFDSNDEELFRSRWDIKNFQSVKPIETVLEDNERIIGLKARSHAG